MNCISLILILESQSQIQSYHPQHCHQGILHCSPVHCTIRGARNTTTKFQLLAQMENRPDSDFPNPNRLHLVSRIGSLLNSLGLLSGVCPKLQTALTVTPKSTIQESVIESPATNNVPSPDAFEINDKIYARVTWIRRNGRHCANEGRQ